MINGMCHQFKTDSYVPGGHAVTSKAFGKPWNVSTQTQMDESFALNFTICPCLKDSPLFLAPIICLMHRYLHYDSTPMQFH